MDAAIIEKEALLLPDTERALLVDRLMESLSPTAPALLESWVCEADDRMRAFSEGRIEAVDGSEAIEKLRSRFGR